MALLKEYWLPEIEKFIYSRAPQLALGRNHDTEAQNGIVHIPNEADIAAVVKNRSSYPATIGEVTDTEVTYQLNSYTTDPVRLRDNDVNTLSYDKIKSVIERMFRKLKSRVGAQVNYDWSASVAGSQLRTTGAATPSHTPSATGNRKKFVAADVSNARTHFINNDIDPEGLYMLVSGTMGQQLRSDLESKNINFSTVVDPKTGKMDELYGFKILELSGVLIYDNTGTPVRKAFGAAGAADDNDSALFFNEDYVARAVTTTKLFEDLASATNYGDVVSAELFFGGEKVLGTEQGVLSMIQDAAA